MLVVDEAALLAVLAETAPADIQSLANDGEVFTTGSWYGGWPRSTTAHPAERGAAL